MANQIKTKFIGNDQVNADKILLQNNTPIRAKNAAGNTDYELIKLDADDKIVLTGLKDPSQALDATHKTYVDDAVAGGGQALQDHINEATDAHDASAISVANTITNLDALNVQAAFAELQGDIDGLDATFVNVIGDEMTGALDITMSGSTLSIDESGFSQSASNASITLNGASGETVKIDSGINDVKIVAANINLNAATQVFSPTGLKKINTDASGVSFGVTDSMTMSGSASSIVMDGEITMSPTNTVTINGDVELNGNLDLNANAINGLVTPSSNGQPLIFDQLGAASGIAPLNSSTKIDSIYLPSYVDDVEEYANLAAFPVSGEASKIYVALDSNKTFRWSGSTYVEVSPSEVNSVNGEFGVVTLDSSHIAENDLENRWYTTARESAMEAYADQAEVDAKAYADGIVATEATTRGNEDLTFLKLDGTRPMEGSLDMSSHSITLANSVNETGNISSFGFSMENNDVGGDLIANTSYSYDSINIYKEVTSTSAQVFSLAYVSGKLSLTESAGAPMVATQPEHVIVKAALDAEVTAIDGRLDALEAVSSEIIKHTLIAGDITNGYIALPFEAVETNDFHVFADRLALHQDYSWVSGTTSTNGDDYRLSVEGGVTRITFLNEMVSPGGQQLVAGDTIYVRYKRSV